jgi:hypothetical protein
LLYFLSFVAYTNLRSLAYITLLLLEFAILHYVLDAASLFPAGEEEFVISFNSHFLYFSQY